MAQLAVTAAINIGIGVALSLLFPPDTPDITQEGPRLTDLGFTSAAYGRFINIIFGTDRVGGNIIDSTDPPITEVVTEDTEEQDGAKGGGGGASTTTRTYTYFLTTRVGFAMEGAVTLVRMWGDGKLIYDASGTSPKVIRGGSITLYRGGPSQGQDGEEVGRRGDQIPAYRHLTSVKIDGLPLADFGNRIPNFTAEIAFNAVDSFPFLNMVEPDNLDPPGALSGADKSYMMRDPNRATFFSLKDNPGGAWSASSASLDFKTFMGPSDTSISGFSQPTAGLDGFYYSQDGASNSEPVFKMDVDTGEIVAQLGSSGISLTNGLGTFRNDGTWHQLSTSSSGLGNKSYLLHMNGFSGAGTGTLIDADLMIGLQVLGTPEFDTMDGFAISDHDRGVFYVVNDAGGGTEFQLSRIDPQGSVGVGGTVSTSFGITELRRFTRGDPSDDFPSASDLEGWFLDRSTGFIMISNSSNMVLYDPESDQIIAKRSDLGCESRNNYLTGAVFAFSRTSTNPPLIHLIDTRTLETVKEIDTTTIPWPASPTNNGIIHDPSTVWEEETQGLILSRVDLNSNAPADFRILKVFLNRVEGSGVPLSFVVERLSTSYNRLEMAGLEVTDVDVTELTGDIVKGYTINNRSSVRAALEPLRKRFFFDGVNSDWIIKFPKRGRAPVATIPEEDSGELKLGQDLNADPPVKQTRTQDVELPMWLGIRYKNPEIDYDRDTEVAKRHRRPNPTMNSKDEKTLDIPIVETPTEMKQTAESWLWTMWKERSGFATVIPWTYLDLDPTDVVNFGYDGETFEVRLTELDVGANFSMDMTGAVEDVRDFTSTIQGGTAGGFVPPQIPSSLPTRTTFLDAPLLSLSDIQLAPISNAYVTTSAFESNWPGCSVFRSPDNVNYNAVSTLNQEGTVGRIKVAPGAWPGSDNRFQEVVEGGTLTFAPLSNPDKWASATELSVLNGANMAAVVTPAGVECFQFQDVVVNDDNSITLERLLRGRLGTEDIVNAGQMTIGNDIVLLSDETGKSLAAPVGKTSLPVALVNQTLLYRTVTIGTLLEDAGTLSFVYTGRDVRPYSVAQLNAVSDGSGGFDLDWLRRVRGPRAGEWLDGTGEVPLNETQEQYEVSFETPVDPEIKLLLPFDGQDNDRFTTDFSTFNRPATFGDKARISDTQAKFGTTSAEFTPDGIAQGSKTFISFPESEDFVIAASQEFTIECWVRFKALSGVSQNTASKYDSLGNRREWILGLASGTDARFLYSLNGVSTTGIQAAWPGLATDTWFHLAVDRDAANLIRVYVDGVVVASSTVSSALENDVSPVRIGKAATSGGGDDRPMDGFVDDFRFVIGTAVYAGAFTPPTAPLNIGGPQFTKTINDQTTANLSAAELAPVSGKDTDLTVRQISGTGLKSPPTSVIVTVP